mgnify:CR=1 FL=1
MMGIVAPILTQAGFKKNTVQQAVSQIINWVPKLDGLTQFFEPSETITVKTGDVVEVDFIGGTIDNIYARFFSNKQNSLTADAGVNGNSFRFKGLTAKLNGVGISNGHLIPTTGKHTLTCTVTANSFIDSICSYGETRLINIPVYNFRVTRNGELIHKIPLTVKAQGATQQPTIGNIFARLINYTNAVWKDEKTL